MAAVTDERGVFVNGQWLLMRRHSQAQWRSWGHRLAAYAPDARVFVQRLTGDIELDYEPMLSLICRHLDALWPLVLSGAGIARSFGDTLSSEDGEDLLVMWWCVNGCHFACLDLHRSWVAAGTRFIH